MCTTVESEKELNADSVKPATIAKKVLTAHYETVNKTTPSKNPLQGMKVKAKAKLL